MNSYVTGTIIRELREKNRLTQADLADRLMVSNKTISKWENGKGLPDISLLEPLAEALGVSVLELMAGTAVINSNKAANFIKSKWYVCPICGNIISTMGEAVISCCGITLPMLEVEEADENHQIEVERVDGEYVVSLQHEMTKQHSIGFIAYCTGDESQCHKLYPEMEAQARFTIKGHGMIYAYCNHHGLYSKRI